VVSFLPEPSPPSPLPTPPTVDVKPPTTLPLPSWPTPSCAEVGDQVSGCPRSQKVQTQWCCAAYLQTTRDASNGITHTLCDPGDCSACSAGEDAADVVAETLEYVSKATFRGVFWGACTSTVEPRPEPTPPTVPAASQ